MFLLLLSFYEKTFRGSENRSAFWTTKCLLMTSKNTCILDFSLTLFLQRADVTIKPSIVWLRRWFKTVQLYIRRYPQLSEKTVNDTCDSWEHPDVSKNCKKSFVFVFHIQLFYHTQNFKENASPQNYPTSLLLTENSGLVFSRGP